MAAPAAQWITSRQPRIAPSEAQHRVVHADDLACTTEKMVHRLIEIDDGELSQLSDQLRNAQPSLP
jgi:hypothetical protein